MLPKPGRTGGSILVGLLCSRIIELQRMDNTKARRMRSDGTYRRVTTGKLPIGAQDALMEDAMAAANLSAPETDHPWWKRLLRR